MISVVTSATRRFYSSPTFCTFFLLLASVFGGLGVCPLRALAQGVPTAWAAYSGGVHLTSGQFTPLQVDANGNLLVNLVSTSLGQSATGPTAVPVIDNNSAAFQGVVPLTPNAGSVSAPLRGVGFVITSPGNVTFTFADNSNLTVYLQIAGGGFQSLPFAVTHVGYPNSGAAVGTFWGLK